MGGKEPIPELVSIAISAWSLKARFALKHHGVKYRTTPYVPGVGELALRWRLGIWRKKVSVPVLFTPHDGVIMQSYDIAKWADTHSARPGAERLFPEGQEAEIARWNAQSDLVLSWARGALVDGMLADPAQLSDPTMLRASLPSLLRPLAAWIGPPLLRMVLRRLRSKYAAEAGASSKDKTLAVLREAQAALKAAPPAPGAPGGLRYLVGGRLSYADMAIGVAVQVVKPLGPPFASAPRPPLKEMQAYQEEFADLVAWRDALFAAHFPVEERKKGR
ncbi:hypothetical protein HYH03_006860 [Edaphochlamys debaryana]|uniref:GST N-terminal domain-containing protein n=1 Tax=Edaphochlamys debaryana TaxID=47281 RepID=A0A835Y2U0_9CHLO|nr:hypothetical protein HYH03_006860 [Edaphochlamys debaryana]|eukprot:KAG2494925.1 hypothetical protein HYH03_006860 [Edaphochlamys debaryana]